MGPSGAVVLGSVLLATAAGWGQVRPGTEGDARASFARAVSLYADGDHEAALVEFQRAYALSQNPNLLYNLGAVYEALGRFVEARDALEAYRTQGARPQVAARGAELTARLAQLRERIGTLRVTAPTEGMRVFLDGREVSAERARNGVAVSAGRRRVRMEAPGFVPREVELDVSGGSEHTVDTPLERRRAPLTLRCDTDGATVRMDGVEVARTPLESPLSLPEGTRRVEVSRPGYLGVVREVELGPAGAVVDVALAWDPAMAPSVAARLRVESNVNFPATSLDGRSFVSDGTAPVPPGPHVLRVARVGHVPATREVVLEVGDNTARVWLDATPGLRDAYAAQVRRQRTVAYVFLGGGLAMLAGAVPLTVIGLADRSAAQSEVDRIDADERNCVRDGCPIDTIEFNAQRDPHLEAFRTASLQAIAGGILSGVGLAATITGVVLRVRSDPSDRYERPAHWSLSPGPGSLHLQGTF